MSIKNLFLTILIIACIASPTWAQEAWKLELMPYAWMTGIEADITSGDRTAEVEVDFEDLLDATDMAGGMLAVGQYRRFVVWGQFDYMALDTDELEDAPENSRLESDTFIGTAAIGYQFDSFAQGSKIDVLGGVRYLNMDNNLSFYGSSSDAGSQDFLDGIVVLRPSFPIWRSLRFNPTMSFGAGDSDLTYELQPQLQFLITNHVAARIGYRRLYYDVEGDRGNTFDGTFHGFIAGLGVVF